MEDCLFCKIVAKKIPVQIVFEDAEVVIFKDIAPKAKVHLLLVPKVHHALLSKLSPKEAEAFGKALARIPALAKTLGLDGGYRLIINQGANAGQSVPHLHVHILSGQQLEWNPA